MRSLVIFCFLFIHNVAGFAFTSQGGLRTSHKLHSGVRRLEPTRLMKMSSDKASEAQRLTEQAAKLREEVAAFEAQKPAVPTPPPPAEIAPVEQRKPEVSDAMRSKLRAELEAQGADYNKKSSNGILIVAAVIGVLVIAGGQGIFY